MSDDNQEYSKTPNPMDHIDSIKELKQGYSWKLNMEVNPVTGEVKATSAVDAPKNIEGGWGAELEPELKPEQVTPEIQDGIPESNMRQTTVPIPTEQIREFFTNKDLFFIANHSESKLQGAPFLTYLTNLNIPADVKFNTPIGYDEYALVMKAYMEQNGVIQTAGLHVMMAELLLVAKGLPYEQSPYSLPIDESILRKFIKENEVAIKKWLHFIDSTQVFAFASIKALDEHYKPYQRFPHINDKEYVGPNIAMLYRIPHFIAVYFSIEGATYTHSYFKHQYEEYMFKNERLAHYFGSENNFAALMFQHFALGTFKVDDITQGLFKIGVFDKFGPFFEPSPYVAVLQV